ncbi:MAG TPA: DedA family protein [Candidatus Bathyarchaeia archaeon]|nr:DedA family protein [Candidatus Bathyarchaeia archaeon]
MEPKGFERPLFRGWQSTLSLNVTIFNIALNLLSQWSYTGVFFLMTLEGATLPVPSEVVLPLTGFLVYQGRLEFWAAVAAATLGSLVGTIVDFGIGYYLGRSAVLRYGKKIKLSERHLLIAERWFAKHGSAAVLLARFVPLLRTLIAFPAGVAKMRIGRFLAFSTVGIVIWDIILIYLGVLAGQNYASIVSSLDATLPLIGYAALGGIVLALLFLLRRSRKEENPNTGTFAT